MLLQLHHQFKDRTEFVAQRDIQSYSVQRQWIEKMQKEFPLPEGAQWMMCIENSEHFIKTHANRNTI